MNTLINGKEIKEVKRRTSFSNREKEKLPYIKR